MKYSLYITIDNNDEIENVFLADIKTMSKAQISKYLKEIAKDNCAMIFPPNTTPKSRQILRER